MRLPLSPECNHKSNRYEKRAQNDKKRGRVRQAGILRRRPIDENAHCDEEGAESLQDLPPDRDPPRRLR